MPWDGHHFARLSSLRLGGVALTLAAGLLSGCLESTRTVIPGFPEPVGTGGDSVSTAGLPVLFTPAAPGEEPPVKLFPEERRARAFSVDAALAADGGAALLAAPRFVFNLFDDVAVVAEVETRETPEPGRFTLSGRLAGVAGGTFLLTFHQGAVTATVSHPARGQFEIEPTGGLAGKVAEYAADRLPRIGHGMLYPDASKHTGHEGHDMTLPPASLVKRAAATPVMDLLVVYTQAAVNGAGGEAAMISRIDKAVAETNVAFANSRIDAQLRLVGTRLVSYAESGNMGTDLGRIQNKTDGFMDDVHALRDAYKADLVSLIVEQAGGIAGIAYVMSSLNSWFKEYAFSVVGRVYTGNYHTLAHELGHNFGCAHDRQQGGSGAFPYSYGYRFTGSDGRQYRDIMAYAPGTPIPYYSNPDVLYMGTPTGLRDGDPASADNARTINQTAPLVEKFFTGVILPPTNKPPTAAISSPSAGATYAGGQAVEFAGSGNDPETGALAASAFTWQVDHHINGQIRSVMAPRSGIASGSFTVPDRGESSTQAFYRITLTVKDAQGAAGTATFDMRPATATVTLAASQPGLQLKLDGQAVAAPHVFTAVAGMRRSVEAVSPQTVSAVEYAFKSWSDGGAQVHEITVPRAAATFTAAYETKIDGGEPSPWTSLSIGNPGKVGLPGSVAVSGGVHTVKGSGYDVWNKEDGFHYAYQTLSGDGTLTARVASMENTHEWAMAGVMVRENTTPGSRHAFVAMSISHGATLHVREAQDASSREVFSTGAAPHWVRLVRSGPSLKGYRSADGVSWVYIGESVQSLPQDVLIGLTVTSHDVGKLCAAAFDNVSLVKDVWTSADVGGVLTKGSTSGYGTVKVIGDGADIWGTADGFHFYHRGLSGDGEIKAKVTGIGATDGWAKAGVMIREGLDAGARHAFTAVTSASGLAFQRREAPGAGSLHVGIAGAAPYWVKLVRTGNVFTSSVSADGSNWTVIGSATVAMGPEARVGLAVTSHRNGTPNTSTFEQVTVTE